MGVQLDGKDVRAVVEKLLENGLVALTAKTALRFLPPLSISYAEIDRGLEILISTLKDMKGEN